MEKESGGGVFSTIFSEIFDALQAAASGLLNILPKTISFLLWVVAAFFVLPCVFVATVIYPAWTEWGEDF